MPKIESVEFQPVQYGAITHIAASRRYEESETRAYFDGTFTSIKADTQGRTIPAVEFPNIIAAFLAGLRVLDSHKHESNGIGKTVHAEVNGDQVDGSFYILKGAKIDDEFQHMELDGQSYKNTLSWIMGLKDGMIDKCSMGWYSERDICNICTESIYSYKCPHYPLESYPITNEETGQEELTQCTYSCYGILPIELSLVYYGANPDARLIAKAKAMAPTFTNEQIDRIESQLKVAIVDKKRSYSMPLDNETKKAITEAVQEAVGKKPSGGGNLLQVTDAQGNVVGTMRPDQLQATEPQGNNDLSTQIASAVTAAVAPIAEKLGSLEDALKTGESLADRETAINAAMKQYNRAFGKDGDEEEHRAYLETLPDIAAIQLRGKKDEEIANALIKAGRQTDGAFDGEDRIETGDDGNDTTSGGTSNPM